MFLCRNLAIGTRLAIGFAPCLAVLLILVALEIKDKAAQVYGAVSSAESIGFAMKIDALVHELQMERGISSGYLASGGVLFGEKVAKRRAAADLALGQINAELAKLNKAMLLPAEATNFAAAEVELENLSQLRSLVDSQVMKAIYIYDGYSKIITALMDYSLILGSSSGEPSALRKLSLYNGLSAFKEEASKERALGAIGFASQNFDIMLHRRFVQVVATEDAAFHLVWLNATPGQRKEIDDILKSSSGRSVLRMRSIIERFPFTQLLYNISAQDWFDAAAQRIDIVKTKQVEVATSLMAHSAQIRAHAIDSLCVAVVILGVLLSLSLFLLHKVISSVVQPLKQLQTRMLCLAGCDKTDISPFLESDENRPQDEISTLAEAFDLMEKRLTDAKLALEHENQERKAAQAALAEINEELENRILVRTALLTESNLKLDKELEERRKIERELQVIAQYDSLTGLPNRRLFTDRLRQAKKRARRNGNRLVLIIFDIDRFRLINDTLGHSGGDLVLQKVADHFREILRLNDTVSRIGSDEFSIIIEDFEGINSLSVIVSKIYAAFKQPLMIGKKDAFVTISGGAVIYPTDGTDQEDLLTKAYIALSQAKADGRNTFRYHSQAMAQSAQRRQVIESLLRPAIAKGDLTLNYQMRISAKTNELSGMEALARWDCAKLGRIAPDEFIPIAEDSGQIIQLGDFVYRAGCQQYASWLKEGLDPGVMAINFSAPQFHQKDFVSWIRDVTLAASVPPENIELELTESMLMEDYERAARVMHELRDLGFLLAIDDFGTGYSSLSQLKKFPFTKIKIDRAFVKNIDNGLEEAAIASAIVTLANNLSMSVTAEGVETLEQLKCLEKLNCDEYQGYYFYKPVSAEEATKILREKHGAIKEKLAI